MCTKKKIQNLEKFQIRKNLTQKKNSEFRKKFVLRKNANLEKILTQKKFD